MVDAGVVWLPPPQRVEIGSGVRFPIHPQIFKAMNLSHYDLVIINSSGGKDSLAAIWEVCRLAKAEGYPMSKIVISHQELGDMEWRGTKELVMKQAQHFGLAVHVSKRIDKNGKEETLLEYAERRKKWPSNKQRWCTSDFKRGPGARVVTALTKDMGDCKVLHVFGFRAEESPARSKKEDFVVNKKLTTKKRKVWDWLPIHDWGRHNVWGVIRGEKLPYHWAYDKGMPRLSCVFCIFSPFSALVVAGKENPELLDRYIETEERIGHTFRDGFSLVSVKKAIEEGARTDEIIDWIM